MRQTEEVAVVELVDKLVQEIHVFAGGKKRAVVTVKLSQSKLVTIYASSDKIKGFPVQKGN